MTAAARSPRHAQRGGFFVGLTVGLLVGLGLALAVALYVTKVPVPFINKVPQRTVEEASQAEKNRTWDPNAPLAGKAAASAPTGAPAPAPTTTTTAKATPAASAPSPAKAGASAASVEAFTYFVQAGAYARPEDAEQQRANLALMGVTAKVTEREQAGRIVYRVRLGPFEQKEEADAAKEKLTGLNVESALVRVQR